MNVTFDDKHSSSTIQNINEMSHNVIYLDADGDPCVREGATLVGFMRGGVIVYEDGVEDLYPMTRAPRGFTITLTQE